MMADMVTTRVFAARPCGMEVHDITTGLAAAGPVHLGDGLEQFVALDEPVQVHDLGHGGVEPCQQHRLHTQESQAVASESVIVISDAPCIRIGDAMLGPSNPLRIPLPMAWPKRIHAAVLHAISLAHFAIAHLRSWAINSRSPAYA